MKLKTHREILIIDFSLTSCVCLFVAVDQPSFMAFKQTCPSYWFYEYLQISPPKNLAKYRSFPSKFGEIQNFSLKIWENTDLFPQNLAKYRFFDQNLAKYRFFSDMPKGFLYILFIHTDFPPSNSDFPGHLYRLLQVTVAHLYKIRTLMTWRKAISIKRWGTSHRINKGEAKWVMGKGEGHHCNTFFENVLLLFLIYQLYLLQAQKAVNEKTPEKEPMQTDQALPRWVQYKTSQKFSFVHSLYCLFGFLMSSSTARLYRWRVPRLTSVLPHKKQRG